MLSNFPGLEKIWKIEIVKSLEFFFSKLRLADFMCLIFFCFGQILFDFIRTFAVHHEKKLCSCVVLITYLITLSLEKEIIVLEKVWKKS